MRSKPIKTDPKLLRALLRAVEATKNMTPEEVEAMLKAQAKSWARQDLD